MMTIEERDTARAIQSMNKKMKDGTKIDWELRRYEIAKDALCAIMADPASLEHFTSEELASEAVGYADALIAELKNE